jgi:hypothetical protein
MFARSADASSMTAGRCDAGKLDGHLKASVEMADFGHPGKQVCVVDVTGICDVYHQAGPNRPVA